MTTVDRVEVAQQEGTPTPPGSTHSGPWPAWLRRPTGWRTCACACAHTPPDGTPDGDAPPAPKEPRQPSTIDEARPESALRQWVYRAPALPGDQLWRPPATPVPVSIVQWPGNLPVINGNLPPLKFDTWESYDEWRRKRWPDFYWRPDGRGGYYRGQANRRWWALAAAAEEKWLRTPGIKPYSAPIYTGNGRGFTAFEIAEESDLRGSAWERPRAKCYVHINGKRQRIKAKEPRPRPEPMTFGGKPTEALPKLELSLEQAAKLRRPDARWATRKAPCPGDVERARLRELVDSWTKGDDVRAALRGTAPERLPSAIPPDLVWDRMKELSRKRWRNRAEEEEYQSLSMHGWGFPSPYVPQGYESPTLAERGPLESWLTEAREPALKKLRNEQRDFNNKQMSEQEANDVWGLMLAGRERTTYVDDKGRTRVLTPKFVGLLETGMDDWRGSTMPQFVRWVVTRLKAAYADHVKHDRRQRAGRYQPGEQNYTIELNDAATRDPRGGSSSDETSWEEPEEVPGEIEQDHGTEARAADAEYARALEAVVATFTDAELAVWQDETAASGAQGAGLVYRKRGKRKVMTAWEHRTAMRKMKQKLREGLLRGRE